MEYYIEILQATYSIRDKHDNGSFYRLELKKNIVKPLESSALAGEGARLGARPPPLKKFYGGSFSPCFSSCFICFIFFLWEALFSFWYGVPFWACSLSQNVYGRP